MAAPQTSVQDVIDMFWKTHLGSTQFPDRPRSVLPNNVYAKLERKRNPKGEVKGASVVASYIEAVKECEAKVAQIVAECRRNNVKYSDPHFNLDDMDYCLEPLTAKAQSAATGDDDASSTTSGFPLATPNRPACAKRVGDIFDEPKFFIGGPPNVRDTRQGAEGDCWFISSLGSLCVDEENRHLVERLCPAKARDERVGVYGFVFYRDGEWVSEIVDDKLYLSCPDYDDCNDERRTVWDRSHSRLYPAVTREGFRKTFQRNSDALFYGSSSDPNETWVPLLEKAFAKAHGDYSAIDGGWPGEGVEDLTGGITTKIVSADILDKDEFWTKGLLKVNTEFLFGAGTKAWANNKEQNRQGIEDSHAYSVLKAVHYKGHRLLLIKNPWGDSEWTGPWSDGSKEWTADALKDLDYQFGNDGIFWMSFDDFLRRFDEIWRTRLFTKEWNVTQRWTTVPVPWSGEYNESKFQFTVPSATRAVIVLSKLDDRYFGGLTGQYRFDLAFRLHQSGEDVHLIRGYSSGDRSASTELDLEAGTYDVLIQISGWRFKQLPKVDDVVKQNWLKRRDKLIQIGLSYDLANAKGQIEKKPEKKAEQKAEQRAPEEASSGAAARNATAAAPLAEGSSKPAADNGTDGSPAAPVEAGIGAEPTEDPAPAPAPAPAPDPETPAPADAPAPASDDDSKENDRAWNATLVVGLRVFCQENNATISVVTPDTDEAKEQSKAKLDVDDPEKDVAEKGGEAPAKRGTGSFRVARR